MTLRAQETAQCGKREIYMLGLRYNFLLRGFLSLALTVASMVVAGPSMAMPVTYQYRGPNFTSASGIYSDPPPLNWSILLLR